MFSSNRIQHLNHHSYKRGSILYWTEWALRYEWNCGLEYATQLAHTHTTSLLPLATIDQDYAHENVRQLIFLIQSLDDLRTTYQKHDLSLSIFSGKTENIIRDICGKYSVGALVASASYVRHFRDILSTLASSLDIPVILVDDASLLPPQIVSDHVEYGAYTLRKKYWTKVEQLTPEIPEIFPVSCLSAWDTLDTIMSASWYTKYLQNTPNIDIYHGGESRAQARWQAFQSTMQIYNAERNNPNKDATSRLSPYLHFGCISPLQIWHDTRDTPKDIMVGFFEECFVRRELAINMWYYEKHPESWKCLPDWAIKTLDNDSQKQQISLVWHQHYTREELIHWRTADPLWNAAQHELILTWKIHGYVRMYWGKQLLHWFDDWREAYKMGVYLNDRFAIDGCSPNGYTGIAWCFGKHDRPFPPKKKDYWLIRSMTLNGMKKKFDTETYIRRWS